MKDSYLVENELIYFRRAKSEDNMDEIARLIYATDPYIYPFWFDNNENKCVDFLKTLGIEANNLRFRDHKKEELCYFRKFMYLII